MVAAGACPSEGEGKLRRERKKKERERGKKENMDAAVTSRALEAQGDFLIDGPGL